MSNYILVARGTKLMAGCSVVISHSQQAWVVVQVCLSGCAARLESEYELRPLYRIAAAWSKDISIHARTHQVGELSFSVAFFDSSKKRNILRTESSSIANIIPRVSLA